MTTEATIENAALSAEDNDSDGQKRLVTGVCDTIGLKLDPIELFEPNLANSAPKGPPRLVTPKDLKDIITDLQLTAKVKPILISFSGLPNSGKSAAVDCLRKKYIDKSVFQSIRNVSCPEAEGIAFYEIVAASLSVVKNLIINEFTTKSCFAPVILSAFKKSFLPEGEVLIFDDPGKTLLSDISEFDQPDLDEHLRFIYQYLSRRNFMVTDSQQPDEEMKKAQFLLKSLPEGIAIVNVWDVTISESVRHFLATLQGHLYNHHMWLFLDLERDFNSLHKPPEIGNESSLFMKWRPRLHYLLRSCKISEDKEKKRKRVCTIFATHNAQSKSELDEKAKILEDNVRPAAKHIGVSSLLEEKIETLNLDVHDDSQRLYQKFQHIISETSFEDIPIAWIFLRSRFYRFDWIYIAREDLKVMAEKCGMDDESLKNFCKFYMSFGSVLDLSLINPNYQYVIVKPIRFLKKLDTLLKPGKDTLQKYPTIASGIIPKVACLDLFGGHFYAYMDALISLNLAVEVTKHNLELPDEQLAIDDNVLYYIPLTRAQDPLETLDPKSIHVISSINTPHIFKQAAFIKYFLQLLPQFKLVPSKERNQTIIKDPSTGTTVTLVSHSPAIRLHLSKPDEHVSSCIVQAFEKIAENARSQGAIVEYKFIKICAESNLKDVQSIPSSHYHILPDDNLCKKCNETSTENDANLLETWNKALTEHRIKDHFQSTGGLKLSEIGEIAEKIISFPSIEITVVADTFGLEEFKNDMDIADILFSWYKQNKNIQEPRRVFARRISELGDRLSQSCKCEDQQKEMKAEFFKMAKDVDIYFDPEAKDVDIYFDPEALC